MVSMDEKAPTTKPQTRISLLEARLEACLAQLAEGAEAEEEEGP